MFFEPTNKPALPFKKFMGLDMYISFVSLNLEPHSVSRIYVKDKAGKYEFSYEFVARERDYDDLLLYLPNCENAYTSNFDVLCDGGEYPIEFFQDAFLRTKLMLLDWKTHVIRNHLQMENYLKTQGFKK